MVMVMGGLATLVIVTQATSVHRSSAEARDGIPAQTPPQLHRHCDGECEWCAPAVAPTMARDLAQAEPAATPSAAPFSATMSATLSAELPAAFSVAPVSKESEKGVPPKLLADVPAKPAADLGLEPMDAEAGRQLLLHLRGKLPEFDPYRGTAYEEVEDPAVTASSTATPNQAERPLYREARLIPAGTQRLPSPSLSRSPLPAPVSSPTVSSPVPAATGEVSDEQLVESLRAMARLLDGRAEQDELAADYGQADQWRRLANHLRRRARQLLEPTSASSAVSEAPANSDAVPTPPLRIGD